MQYEGVVRNYTQTRLNRHPPFEKYRKRHAACCLLPVPFLIFSLPSNSMLKSSFTSNKIEAGCDEAGRGCLAGPVVAAAVILPADYTHDLLNDSKQLNRKQRNQLREEVKRNAVAWAVNFVDHEEIDRINILNASYLAMENSVRELKTQPELLLIDGNRFKTSLDIPFECVVKGDGKFFSIAAASILAKTYRDDFMEEIDTEHPEYQWKQNKGYPTAHHREMVRTIGLSPYHRKSFQLKELQGKLF